MARLIRSVEKLEPFISEEARVAACNFISACDASGQGTSFLGEPSVSCNGGLDFKIVLSDYVRGSADIDSGGICEIVLRGELRLFDFTEKMGIDRAISYIGSC